MPKYMFFYPGDTVSRSDISASEEESLDQAVQGARDFVSSGISKEVMVAELDRDLYPNRIVAHVKRSQPKPTYDTEVTVY